MLAAHGRYKKKRIGILFFPCNISTTVYANKENALNEVKTMLKSNIRFEISVLQHDETECKRLSVTTQELVRL
jgi:hypothetical protein